ncbi:MAG TPA: MEKHLA domain-containing protein [Nitrospirales bacterium]|nr:MEKHLA domain-containing protein [Nitrospirales bacterium]
MPTVSGEYPWQDPAAAQRFTRWTTLLLDSYRQWTGRELIAREGDAVQQAQALFDAPFVVVSHGRERDPVLNYGNRVALELWEAEWAHLLTIPSRQTTEPINQAERERMLAQAAARGYIDDYHGVRISTTGRRFAVEQALVWNVIDESGHVVGQAATFSQWTFLPDPAPQAEPAEPAPAERIYRHSAPVRIGHWINVLCLFILIMSGFQIFNAHPALYWGDRSDRDRPWLAMRAMQNPGEAPRGVTIIGGHTFTTTGVFGFSNETVRGFPSWLTVPGGRWLAMGRRWHLFFAWLFVINGLLYAAYSVLSRHVARDLVPTMSDLRGIGRSIWDHLRFHHPGGEEAKRYNVLQRLAYVGVLFGLAPLIVLSGLAMSPDLDAAFPWLTELFGGRQSARSIHFLACITFIGFIVVHLVMVMTTGLVNNLRSIISGWFVVPAAGGVHEPTETTPDR